MNKVGEWLRRHEIGQYEDDFAQNSITWKLLPELTADDLKELGLNIGERRQFLNAVLALSSLNAEPGAQTPTAAVPVRSEAERRQLTVMFCDLVGSTNLSGQLDPEDLREVVRAYQKVAEGAINRFGGHIAQYLGDGLLVYFGYPVAHEDDAARAVHASLGIGQAIDVLNESLRTRYSIRLSVRIGIHTGQVVVGEMGANDRQENLAMGETPNVAARLQGLAEPDAVVISEATQRLLGQQFELSALGGQSLKGIADTVDAFVVSGERVTETRFAAGQGNGASAIVGRQQELALLLDRWRQAVAGEGQLVVLTGEAGIGKSRLMSALIDAVAPENHVRISYQCSPYHTDSALFPAIQQLTFAARFAPDDSPDAKLDKLESVLRQAHEDISNTAPLLGALMGLGEVAEARHGTSELSPQERRVQTLQAVLDQLIGVSKKRPALFVLEDAHWIDPTTLELIELALEQVGEHRIMLLITARPTFNHGFGGHPIVSRLALNRLGREQIIGIVERLTKGKALPQALLDEIAAKTDGVPLFVEEFTKTLLESGQLRETANGYEFDGRLDQLTIPSSLHDSLMARLDRMQPIKKVAQAAACIGREFGFGLLAAVSSMTPSQLTEALEQLITAELIFKRGVPPQATYMFKHALVRDAAYESLLKTQRQVIHDGLLKELETHDGTSPQILAYHAYEAGHISAAGTYWERAGDQAVNRPAFSEAMSAFKHALECLQGADTGDANKVRELDLQVKLCHTSLTLHGYAHPITVKANDQAYALLSTVPGTPHRFPVLYSVWVAKHVLGETASAMSFAEEMCEQSQLDGDRVHHLISYRVRGATRVVTGDFLGAATDLEQALAHHDPQRDARLGWIYGIDPSESARYYLALSLICRGEASSAWAILDKVEDVARERGHLPSYASALAHLTWIARIGRIADRERLDHLYFAIADTHGLRWHHGSALRDRAARLNEQNKHAAAIELTITAKEILDVSRSGLFSAHLHAVNASSLAALGRLDESSEAARTATDLIGRGVDGWASAEIHRLLADSQYWHRADAKTAIAGLQHSMAIAVAQGAKLWELRAAVSLARVWDELGDRTQALELLTPVVENFPVGGRDLADMVEAGILLRKLG